MYSCKNCEARFSFFEIFKSYWLGYKKLNCQECSAAYKHAGRNKVLGSLLGVIPLLVTLLLHILTDGISLLIFFSIYLVLALILSFCLIPFMKFERIK